MGLTPATRVSVVRALFITAFEIVFAIFIGGTAFRFLSFFTIL